MLIIILERLVDVWLLLFDVIQLFHPLLSCFLCYALFLLYMLTSESLLSHDALCMCVFVHMLGCFLYFNVSFMSGS